MPIYGARPTFAPSSSSSSSSGLYVSANTDFRRDEKRVTGGSVKHIKHKFSSFSYIKYHFTHPPDIVKAPTIITIPKTEALSQCSMT